MHVTLDLYLHAAHLIKDTYKVSNAVCDGVDGNS